eukprot:CAMPEP_0196794168 /NCGR_PEP_ID=MMETSP1104-20130614/34046_1 /TAXON_ID=33652 /ORGANISM="Cafeteria sp., Strain Caron Lab Isolate" /LENGTH=68 /DNA_ID=CAMNT_0042164547 /DNA_START=195 /DNA_END=398 /DNA_ORIENTATION=-
MTPTRARAQPPLRLDVRSRLLVRLHGCRSPRTRTYPHSARARRPTDRLLAATKRRRRQSMRCGSSSNS